MHYNFKNLLVFKTFWLNKQQNTVLLVNTRAILEVRLHILQVTSHVLDLETK